MKILFAMIFYIWAVLLDMFRLDVEAREVFFSFQSLAGFILIILSGYHFVRVVDNHKAVETVLQRKKNEMAALLDSLPDKIWLKDIQSKYILANRQFLDDLGISKETIKGKTAFDIWQQDTAEKFSRDDEEVVKDRKTIRVERPVSGNNDLTGWVEILKSPILNDEGEVVGTVGIARDITERKNADHERKILESQLRQSQKMEAIGTLAGGIAHDFNNILAAIMGYTEISMEKVSREDEVYRKLERVLQAGHRGKELVDQILTFSRRQEKSKKPLQLALIVEEALKLLRPLIPSTIEIKSNLTPSSGFILSDPTQIHQVLMNLCTNSAFAMRRNGGALEIEVKDIEVDAKDIEKRYVGLTPGPHVQLTVSDTGQGLDKKTQRRVFEPFFTTKKQGEGTGMGLSVVHGIVKSMKGIILVESVPDKGASFSILFPRIGNAFPEEKTCSCKNLSGNEWILLVDDEEFIVDVTGEMLESLGYKVSACKNSLEALELFKKEADRIQLVITDQTMPQMTGEELANAIKKIRPEVPVIICSGFSNGMSSEKAMAMGIEAFLMKPFVKSDLANSVRHILDNRR